MKSIAGLLLAIVALPAYAQDAFTCGPFKTETKRTATGTQWTIARGAEKSMETAVLKSGPRFDCVAGEVLAIEFTTSAGMSKISVIAPRYASASPSPIVRAGLGALIGTKCWR